MVADAKEPLRVRLTVESVASIGVGTRTTTLQLDRSQPLSQQLHEAVCKICNAEPTVDMLQWRTTDEQLVFDERTLPGAVVCHQSAVRCIDVSPVSASKRLASAAHYLCRVPSLRSITTVVAVATIAAAMLWPSHNPLADGAVPAAGIPTGNSN